MKASFKNPYKEIVYGAEAVIPKALESFKVVLAHGFRKEWKELMKVNDPSVPENLLRKMTPELPLGETVGKIVEEEKRLGLPFFVMQWMERMDSSTHQKPCHLDFGEYFHAIFRFS